MSFNFYPYTDFHDLNLDWIIEKIKELGQAFNDFEAVNKITNAGAWDITKQYQAWTVVSDNNIGYISLKAVPAGVAITNTEYWGVIADYDILITDLSNRISALEYDNASNIARITNLETEVSDLCVNVKSFGAVGDGVADDTQAFDDAVAECISNGYKTLFIPVGEYRISGLAIPSGFYKCNIIGENSAKTILRITGSVGITIRGGSGLLTGNVIKNLVIAQAGDAIVPGSNGIKCAECCGVIIENVKFSYWDKAIYCNNVNAGFTEGVVARRCSFVTNNYTMYFHTEAGASQYSYHGCGLDECYISNNNNNVVFVDSNCLLYNAPLSFTVWSDGSYPFIYLNAAGSAPNNTKCILAYGSIKYEMTGATAPVIFGSSSDANIILYNGTIEGIGTSDLYILGEKAYITDGAVMYSDASLGLVNARKKTAFASPAPGSVIYTAKYHIHKIYYILNGPSYWEMGYFFAINSHIAHSIEDKTVLQRYAPGNDNINLSISSGGGISYTLNSGNTLNSLTLYDTLEIQ